jgi:bifunctional non-homologous end joining protein LigD
LLLCYYDDDALRYAGRVSTGFDSETPRSLGERFASMERKTCPYAETPDAGGSPVHWVKPELMAEIGFTQRTGDHRLRHPTFLGLRRDKPARRVVRKEPQ